MRFEWSASKAAANLAKHGVGFEEAVEAFFDSNAVTDFDAQHSDDEQRFYLIGFSSRRLLFVIYSERDENDEIIRLISARKAEAKRQFEYNAANSETDNN